MTFYSDFSDIEGNVYKIEISSETPGENVYITMAGNPCTIKSSSSKLFTPIKSRSCKLNIVSTEWYFDLYEPKTRGTSVKIYKYDETAPLGVGKVIFRGYLTPCAYDQTFTYLDKITLNAVDGLSTAKDYKWQDTGTYVSFFSIVQGIIQGCGYQGELYVPYVYDKINGDVFAEPTDVLKSLYACSTNFIDDDDERTPWKQYEVLEEIMQFLGWSVVPDGDDVWLIDYKAEANGSVEYFKYNIQTGNLSGTYTSTLISDNINDFAAPGTAKISIDDIYNKISISDNLYKIDEISPDIFDDDAHISVTDEADLGEDQSKWSTVERKKFLFWEWGENSKTRLTGKDYQTLCRLKPDTGWIHYYYKMSDGTLIGKSDNPIYEEAYYDPETALNPSQKGWYGSKTIQKVNTMCCLMQHYAFVDESHPNNVPAKIDWSDILTFFVLGPTTVQFPYAEMQTRIEKPMLEYNIGEEIQWKPRTGTSWITINGSLFYQSRCQWKDGKHTKILTIVNDDEGWYATTPIDKSLSSVPSGINLGGPLAVREEDNGNYGKGFKMWKMKIQIGDGGNAKWWNGDEWTTSESTFYLNFNNNPDNDGDEYIPAFQWIDIVNNVTFKDKVGKDCYAIPIDSEDDDAPSIGRLKLTIYCPKIAPDEYAEYYALFWGFKDKKCGFGTYATPVIYCKDFELGYVYTNTNVWYNNHEDDNKADKVYTGEIDVNYKMDFSDMQFKLNTVLPEKPISRSFVSTSNGYLNTLKHICNTEEKEQEYNIIDMYLDHHSERKPIYEANVHGMFLPNHTFEILKTSDDSTMVEGTFMVDSQSWDVANNNNRIKIIAF